MTHRSHVGDGKGGVQRCTNEYIQVIAHAGIDLDVLEITHDERLLTRIARRAYSSPYFRPISISHVSEIERRSRNYDFLFLNQVALAGGLPKYAEPRSHQPKRILLSHGAEVTDYLHLARLRADLPLSGRLRPNASIALGGILRDEVAARKCIDAVVGLSSFDAQFETWLGSKYVTWLPRVVTAAPLNWKPNRTHFGFVGTLDHAPNLEGLVRALDALRDAQTSDVRVRVVGGPQRIGVWLSERYSSVDYLGALDDAALEAEAASWRAFLHPIFCQARGCSTKLAAALSWEIPIVTTPLGRRGYVWHSGALREAETPAEFVEEIRHLMDDERLSEVQRRAADAARSSPSIPEVADRFLTFLDVVDRSLSGSKVKA